ncbi:MAG: peroxidase [Zetaproteobacteria bacterium CG_4_9_14_3_um_filter_49_83]|nr:MAG: peroxidase [Zetaproteobacteria bacterium CG1_02_49_23]PIQ33041.1 MAG: peroxidase [Zetaproteobacteria bacterium CG17_big_fil_post_rev_8_21_14_2_50_50_13]PIY55198.1 MAG: peroxidase [Zetaproteobacteria bacterium CG_4_10_14_0_8_um_filter_49_80]PJA35567.1 MAG: peroxidase [Zetaproteobacteria bacterium CG_4_9_14_3_um_filter_49_83]
MSVLVSKQAPEFTAVAVMPDGSINEGFSLSDYEGKYVVLFFYPLDFTFVCPSELIAFDHRIKEFEARGVQVIGCSVDSQFSHVAWRNTPVNQGGIGPVAYPLVADLTKKIAADYDVLLNNTTIEDEEGDQYHLLGGDVALRGSFLIDKDGVVQHQVVNNLPLGRNIDEMLRMIDALQFTEEHGEVCPAGWNKGDKGMAPSADGVASYLASEADKL